MAGSRFGVHLRWWLIVVPVLVLALMPLIDAPELFAIPDDEVLSVRLALGHEEANERVEQTNALFKHVLVDTGFVRHFVKFVGRSEFNGDGMARFAEHWGQNFCLLVYRMMYRIEVMKAWLWGIAILCAAAYVEGTTRRKIRAAMAGLASPLSFHLAAHALLLVFGVVMALLLAPVSIVAAIWTGLGVVLMLLVWRAAAAFR